MNKLIRILVLAVAVIPTSDIEARVSRISEPQMDISKPMIIRMTPGRATVVDFPCEILPTILGLTNDVVAKVGPDSLKTLTLWVKSDVSQSTNMIVKCEGEVFVFDLLPNNHDHQDYINILNSFDGRRRGHRTLIGSSKVPRTEKKGKLIASSKDAPKSGRGEDLILRALNKNSSMKNLIKRVEKK